MRTKDEKDEQRQRELILNSAWSLFREKGCELDRSSCSESRQNGEMWANLDGGRPADIAAWKRDLITDPKALLNCAFAMKEGTVYQIEAFGE